MAETKKIRKRKLSEKPLIVVAAGGTGGHMFPAEALAREMMARGWDVVLASDSRGDTYAKTFPCRERLSLDAATFKPGDPIGMVRAGFKILNGFLKARAAFARLKPWAVVGFGGYPSVPALMAAISRQDITVLHEQNSVLGRSNRNLCTRVDAMACAFPVLRMAPLSLEGKVVVVGNPVRPDIQALYDQPYPTPEKEIRILVTGGSQGAKILSQNIPLALAQLPMSFRINLKVEQQTRKEQLEEARAVYKAAEIDAEVEPFFTNMAERLSRAHLVIGRSGASTVCELAVAGRPSVLIPLKIAADDHQTFNAEVLREAKAAVVIAEDAATPEKLAEEIRFLIEAPAMLKLRSDSARSVAKPNAAKSLADLIIRTLKTKGIEHAH